MKLTKLRFVGEGLLAPFLRRRLFPLSLRGEAQLFLPCPCPCPCPGVISPPAPAPRLPLLLVPVPEVLVHSLPLFSFPAFWSLLPSLQFYFFHPVIHFSSFIQHPPPSVAFPLDPTNPCLLIFILGLNIIAVTISPRSFIRPIRIPLQFSRLIPPNPHHYEYALSKPSPAIETSCSRPPQSLSSRSIQPIQPLPISFAGKPGTHRRR